MQAPTSLAAPPPAALFVDFYCNHWEVSGVRRPRLTQEERNQANRIDEDQKYRELRPNAQQAWNMLIDVIKEFGITLTFNGEKKMECVESRR